MNREWEQNYQMFINYFKQLIDEGEEGFIKTELLSEVDTLIKRNKKGRFVHTEMQKLFRRYLKNDKVL